MTNFWKGLAILVALVCIVNAVFLALSFAHTSNPSFGGVGLKLAENYDPYIRYNGGYYSALPISTTGTFQVGASGTAQSNQVSSSCAMQLNVSITASTTGYGYCTGVTGVTSADNVLGMFSTSTLGWRPYLDNIEIISAKASTTPGAIDFEVYNGTGQTAAPSALNRTGSTTALFVSH